MNRTYQDRKKIKKRQKYSTTVKGKIYPRHYLSLSLFPPFRYLGIDLIPQFRLNFTSVACKQREKALGPAVYNIDFVQ